MKLKEMYALIAANIDKYGDYEVVVMDRDSDYAFVGFDSKVKLKKGYIEASSVNSTYINPEEFFWSAAEYKNYDYTKDDVVKAILIG